MNELKITVGIAVKNNATTIQDAIRSVLSQNFPHEKMEIIVVDGMSTDATVEIIRKNVSKSDIHTDIFSDNGKGLGLARQMIVDKARGEYIMWVDGDIVIPKDYLSNMVEFLDRNPQVGAVQGNRWTYTGESIVAILEIMSNLHYVFERERNRLATRGAVYRVRAIREAGGFDKNIKGAAEDIDLSVRMHQKGWLLFMHEGEWTHIARETWKELWDEFWWYGYGMHFIGHKHRGLVVLWQWFPLASLVSGYMRSLMVYKITGRKIAFLLPLHFFYRGLAWWLGYIKSNIDGYGHRRPVSKNFGSLSNKV
jgi:succinoglycan biosynthesis protein ExoA